MSKRVDEKFDEIILKKVLPLIAEAFCDMDAELKANHLTPTFRIADQTLREHYHFKADQLQKELVMYIDGQVDYFTSR